MKRPLKAVDPAAAKHPEPKLARMAEIIRARVRHAEEAEAEAKRREAEKIKLGDANGDATNGTEPSTPAPTADAKGQEDETVKKEEEREEDKVPSDEMMADMQEELESLQKLKHLLFV